MRYRFLYISLLFCSTIQCQIAEWNNELLKSNKIRNASIYMEVPPTNPERDKDGLVKIESVYFNSDGYVILDTCFNCLWIEDRDDMDIINKFNYYNKQLIKQVTISNDTITYDYKQKDGQDKYSLKFGSESLKGNVSTTVIKKYQTNKIQGQIELDYSNSYHEANDICQVFFKSTEYDYSKKDTVSIIIKRNPLGVCIDKGVLDLIINSNDLEKTYNQLNDLSRKNTSVIEMSYYVFDEKKNLKSIIGNNSNLNYDFIYNKNGLIESKILRLDEPIVFRYKYKN